MKLAISLATRDRPDRVIDTVRRSVANWTSDETIMEVQLDDDDPKLSEYIRVLHEFNHERVYCNVKPRESTIAGKWNRIVDRDFDVYLIAADDDAYITPGYDTKIIEAAKRFPDHVGMVY